MSIAATVGEVIVVDMEARIHHGFVVIVSDPEVMLSEYLSVLLGFIAGILSPLTKLALRSILIVTS
ncbi:hypothetical protein LX90_009025 [Lentzea flava]|nr:hypothetical protein [Lentzea flava]